MRKYVFSYGSNLTLERIAARTPSVQKVRNYCLADFSLQFNKRSRDGSTKANIEPTPGAFAWGIIQSILPEDEEKLDRAEGLGQGYSKHYFEEKVDEKECRVFYYSADWIAAGDPYDWYLDYVIYGAITNNFPAAYIQRLGHIRAKQDPIRTSGGFNDRLTRKIDRHRNDFPDLWKMK